MTDQDNTRPATSAASEGEVSWWWVKGAKRLCGEEVFSRNRTMIAAWEDSDQVEIIPLYAALASPPVSERERELEGALRMAANRMDRLALEVQFDTRLRAEAAEWVAEARALTAQPAGEGK